MESKAVSSRPHPLHQCHQQDSNIIMPEEEALNPLALELGLKKKDIMAVSFAFDVYDFKGDGKVDGFYIPDLLRACNLNPTIGDVVRQIGEGTCEEEGREGEWEKDKKFISLDELWPIFKACKESKERGGFHDYMEILKLYDKNNDDSMQGNDLFKLLTQLGEKLTKEEAKTLMNDLCEPEDEDGFMPFKRESIPSCLTLNDFSLSLIVKSIDHKLFSYFFSTFCKQIIS